MNKIRRNKISEIVKKLEAVKSELNNVLIEEEIVFDNMPENLQGSRRGEESEEAIDCMNEASDSIDNVISELENAIGNLGQIY